MLAPDLLASRKSCSLGSPPHQHPAITIPTSNPSRLPIYEIEPALLAALAAGNRILLQAPTGSGKSTQIPQILLDRFLAPTDGEIVVLQPRRLPTRMLAARVAAERGARLGGEVGYQMRFDSVVSRDTRIRFVTEGTLLRQMTENASLPGIAAILFDEFHERHLQGDVCLALALQIAATKRPDLRLIVMSATLDSGRLADYLAPCTVIRSEGRTFPVATRYLDRPVDFERTPPWEVASQELAAIWGGTEGDALIFMPGALEIQRTLQALANARLVGDPILCPLHGELPPEQQDAAVVRSSRRKVVVSTNVAETSLTIPGITIVVDAGLARIPRYDPHRGIDTLLIEKISRASAEQRAGRAGRTAPGTCLRLWTEREHESRPHQELPEIRRVDLAEPVLSLKAAGIDDLSAFNWLDAPDPKSLAQAITLLSDLGALAPKSGTLTPTGRRMLAFPLHPRYSRMLLEAANLGCVRTAAALAALTQTRGILVRNADRRTLEQRDDTLGDNATSDFDLLLRAWSYAANHNFRPEDCRALGIHGQTARQVSRIHEQFLRIAERQRLPVEDTAPSEAAVARCLLTGFPDRVARRVDAGTLRYDLVHRRRGTLVRESVARDAEFLIAAEIREIESKGDPTVLLSLATPIQESWLRELYPDEFTDGTEVAFDSVQRRVTARSVTRFRDLVLRDRLSGEPPLDKAAALLATEVIAGRCPLAHWDHAVDQWITRVNRLVEWAPEAGLTRIDEEARHILIEQVCHGALSYKDLKDRQVWPAVKAWVSASLLPFIDSQAPERIELPSGRKAKITYQDEGPPVIAARIQDLYGVTGNLTIASGRVPLRIEVLAPNHRPVQITDNLANFWKESYPKLKQELQRKYPKHEWR